MGIIDPIAIGSMATTGVLEFSNGPALWFLTVGLLSAMTAAIALSGVNLRRIARLRLPKLAHAQLVTAGVSGAK
jgi:hypothetical protein